MSLGTLVQMKGDPHGTIGVIIEVIDDKFVSNRYYYKVLWVDDICDPSYADEDGLVKVCK